jgi:phosphatidyl-myo-inositol dimannoside synthase
MSHLLVTNDFPPKIGGIQSYLWELWRRLPDGEAVVLTTAYEGAEEFDRLAPMPVIRTKARLLLPTRALERQILELAEKYGTDLVVLDPALPVGWLGPRLKAQGLRYAVVLHGAEVTVPGRLPAAKQVLSRVLRNADHVIAAGGYPLAEGEHAAGRLLAATVIPPGIDIERFTPVGPDTTPAKLRAELGLPESVPLIVSTSRLVPRKGRDVLIRAADLLREEFPGLCVAISGTGRDLDRLRKIAARHPEVDVRFLGRLSDDELADLYRAGDLFVMLCRNRWAGLEQEGFGIVFLEAAASGLAQVAGLSGGSHEAVLDGVTGVVVDRPNNVRSAADAIGALLRNPDQRAAMGTASRQRAVAECTYDLLAERLMKTLAELDAAHTGHRANSSARR